MFNFLKRNKKVTLQDFSNKVADLAISIDGKPRAFCVQVEKMSYSNGGSKIDYKCYIEGYSYHAGRTMEEALDSIKNSISPKIVDQKIVEI